MFYCQMIQELKIILGMHFSVDFLMNLFDINYVKNYLHKGMWCDQWRCVDQVYDFFG
jgi:hypothetical protein